MPRAAVILAREVKTLRARWVNSGPISWAEYEATYQQWGRIDKLIRDVLFYAQPTLFDGGTDDG